MTVTIQHGSALSMIAAGAPPEVLEFADSYLTFDDASAYFKPHVRAGHSDGKIRLFRKSGASFPAGFTTALAAAVREEFWIDVTVRDNRSPPCRIEGIQPAAWLTSDPKYSFQVDAFWAAIRAARGILWIPTGGGKTEIAVALAAALPCGWLFVVRSKDLLENAAARWERHTGIPAGRIGDGRYTPSGIFTVATIQSLAKRIELTAERQRLAGMFGGLIVDEVHNLPAKTMYQTCLKLPAYYRFGLSGTPLARSDRKSIMAMGVLGPIIYRVRPAELIRRGVIAAPTITMTPYRHTDPTHYATYQGAYGAGIVRSTPRNDLIVGLTQKAPKPALVFVKQQQHGARLTKQLQRAGLQVEFCWGKTSLEGRLVAAKRLQRGDLEVVVCSVIWQEGIDIPELRSIVVAASGNSAIAAIQRIGRGTRATLDKVTVRVFDVDDQGQKWFEKHAKQRKRAYRREGYVVEEEGSDGTKKKSAKKARHLHDARDDTSSRID